MQVKTAITAEHLVKKFGDSTVVNDMSFAVKTGEVFGLLGPNGAGKTTTLRMITTLLKPTSGNVTIFGHDVRKEGRLARSMFGLTGQYASVDEDISAQENLMIFARLNGLTRFEAKYRTAELLDEFSLADVAKKSLKDFSGGMRRRLDLAVSLITRPALIFLDEPTTGLDPRTRTQMWKTIRNLVNQGSTIVLTTQYLDEADALADRIAVIDHGRMVKIGTPNELKQEIGGVTLKLTLVKEQEKSTAQQLLSQEIDKQIQVNDGQLTAHLKDANQVMNLLARLQTANVQVRDIDIQKPTLDDVFFELTEKK
ncbi:ATP-binding cassette domain-containing protein [Furfurilactobacillus entadae]|uniref:ATP-binding cassette domain-containing protein n=1 Tax=Furfurilactobacillus entadae TaxID=2922307 RepID=UPI0035EDB8B0